MKSIDIIKDEWAVAKGYHSWQSYYDWISREGEYPSVVAQLIESAMEQTYTTYIAQSNQPLPADQPFIDKLPNSKHASFQKRVDEWLIDCFTEPIARLQQERNWRFLEEAIELVQSLGCTKEDAHKLVQYVYDRPKGESTQECGGVMVTLAALCLANDIDMVNAGEVELKRIWALKDAIRKKRELMPFGSPLPVNDAKYNDNFELQRLYDWLINENRKPATNVFTSGLLRNVAKEIEFKIWNVTHRLQSFFNLVENEIELRKMIDTWCVEKYGNTDEAVKKANLMFQLLHETLVFKNSFEGELKSWTQVKDGIINVPDELDKLINSIGMQLRFHKISGKSEGQTVCDIAYIAQKYFRRQPAFLNATNK